MSSPKKKLPLTLIMGCRCFFEKSYAKEGQAPPKYASSGVMGMESPDNRRKADDSYQPSS
jgi:hypothetical protein